MRRRVEGAERPIDLAIIGAGVAGAHIAAEVKQARPDWTIVMFERSARIGGRLRSIGISGIEHRIELGGMRFLTSHRRVASIIDEFDLPTHPFDRTQGSERLFLRGRLADPTDPRAGAGYELSDDELGRTALDLVSEAFELIIPGALTMSRDDFLEQRATASYLGRPLTDWSIADALATLLSPEAQRYVTDVFGYDSGMRAFNVGDAIEFLLGGGDPSAEARTPDEGMEAIPRALAERFEAAGGMTELEHELESIEIDDGIQRLRFSNGRSAEASRTVVTAPIPALRLIAGLSPAMQTQPFERVLDAVEGFPAMKLYLWFDRPWWRPGVAGIRTTTDLPVRKVFYVDSTPDAPAALLAMYTDGWHVQRWTALAASVSEGHPAPDPMLGEVMQQLAMLHPDAAEMPLPIGSALMHWGADPHEIGWTFWRPGFNSDQVIERAAQPDPPLPIYIAGEAFSHHQSWVEGAIDSAQRVVETLLEG